VVAATKMQRIDASSAANFFSRTSSFMWPHREKPEGLMSEDLDDLDDRCGRPQAIHRPGNLWSIYVFSARLKWDGAYSVMLKMNTKSCFQTYILQHFRQFILHCCQHEITVTYIQINLEFHIAMVP
jgi:hypothetical protein